MDLSTNVLGSTAVAKLSAARTEGVLKIGADSISREQLADAGCYNFLAARRLTSALADLGAKDLRDVFERFPPRDIALPNVGVYSLFVLGCAFQVVGVGGKTPLDNYVKKHSEKVTTFHSIKLQVKQLAAQENGKPRRRARRR